MYIVQLFILVVIDLYVKYAIACVPITHYFEVSIGYVYQMNLLRLMVFIYQRQYKYYCLFATTKKKTSV